MAANVRDAVSTSGISVASSSISVVSAALIGMVVIMGSSWGYVARWVGSR